MSRFAQQQVDLIVRSVQMTDVKTGKITAHQAIAVRHDSIIGVMDDQQAGCYKAAQVFDAGNCYAMPSLWDMHMHFGSGDTLAEENKSFLPLYLAHGIRTVRDCAADISPLVLHLISRVLACTRSWRAWWSMALCHYRHCGHR